MYKTAVKGGFKNLGFRFLQKKLEVQILGFLDKR